MNLINHTVNWHTFYPIGYVNDINWEATTIEHQIIVWPDCIQEVYSNCENDDTVVLREYPLDKLESILSRL